MATNRFEGADNYVLDEELSKIVNISMALEMPLLLRCRRFCLWWPAAVIYANSQQTSRNYPRSW